MRKRPMLLLAGVFLLGILWRCYGSWTIAITFLSGVYFVKPLLVKRKWKRAFLRVMLCVCIFVIGALRVQSQQSFREKYLRQMEDGEEAEIQGEIFKKEYKNEQYTYYLKDCYIALSRQSVPCNYVMVSFASEDYSIGEILILDGKINMFTEASNEGQFDLRAFYRSQKIDFAIRDAKVRKSLGKVRAFEELLYDCKLRLHGAIELVMGEDANAGVLEGMLLGEKAEIDSEQKELYQNAGISHLLAISALHISIFAMGIYSLLKSCSVALVPRVGLAILFVDFYGRMTGNSVSTQRAGLMFAIMLSALLWARTYDMLNALGVWLILTLWENPFIVGYSGFIFSLCAVLGIGFTVNNMEQESEEGYYQSRGMRKWGTGLRKNIMSCIWIQLTTLPMVAFYYYEIPSYAILLNVILVPLLTIVLISGAAGAVVGLFSVPMGKIMILPAKGILWFYQWMCGWTQDLPFSQVIVGQPSVRRMLVYYFVLACLLVLNGKKTKERDREKIPEKNNLGRVKWIFVIILLLILYIPRNSGEEIVMLDVGQGEGIFLSTEDHKTFFIDGGSTSVKKVGNYRILPFLKSRGVRHLDRWFLSHGDEDHMNGLLEVLASGYPVRQIILSSEIPEDDAYDTLIDAAEKQGISVVYMKAGERICTGKTEFVCVFPERDQKKIKKNSLEETSLDRNQLSLCLLYQSEQMSAFFGGDISSEEEKILLENPILAECLGEEDGKMQIDVYKSSHHGSKYSNSQSWLECLSPRIALVSSGKNNRYGHPHPETVERLERTGSEIFYTMESGQITIQVEKGRICVKEYRGS